jgi:hypothetical protein
MQSRQFLLRVTGPEVEFESTVRAGVSGTPSLCTSLGGVSTISLFSGCVTTVVLHTARVNLARGITRRTEARFVFSLALFIAIVVDVVVVIIMFLFLLLFRFILLLVLLQLVTSVLFVTECPTFCGLVGVRNTTYVYLIYLFCGGENVKK